MNLILRIVVLALFVVLGVLAVLKEPAHGAPVVTTSPVAAARLAEPVAKRKWFSGEGHVEDPPGWSFPISCDRVRWYAAHFSESTLNKMRIAAGLPEPTPAQKAEGYRCIHASGK